MNKLRFVVFCFLLVCLSPNLLHGHSGNEIYANYISLEFVGDARGNLPIYPSGYYDHGMDVHHQIRGYIEAARGERYSIRIRNNSERRMGLVISVDGRNIISGSKSYLRPSESMYVLNPYGSGVFSGWRTGTSRVNRFFFADSEDSYAGAWGDFSRMGIIAIAVFPERKYVEPIYNTNEYSKLSPHRPQASMERDSKGGRSESAPGTGFGEDEYSPVHQVDFEPESISSEHYSIQYEWPEKLRQMGVISYPYPAPRVWEDDRHDFAPTPPNRKKY